MASCDAGGSQKFQLGVTLPVVPVCHILHGDFVEILRATILSITHRIRFIGRIAGVSNIECI